MKFAVSLCVLVSALLCVAADAADPAVQKLQAKIAADAYPEDLATSLVKDVGPRFAGSDGYEHAVIWALQKLQAAGFKNVHAEPVILPRWVRGATEVTLELSRVDSVPLTAVAIGGSVGTDTRGIEADVVRVESLQQLQQLTSAQVRGRIVFIDHRMQRTRDASGYIAAYPIRKLAPAEAGRKGAAAILIRSLSTAQDDVAHTGDLDYGDAPKIPALALSNLAADKLSSIVRVGGATVTIKLDARELGAVYSSYVVGEVPGKTDEVVLLGAHLDSWDITPGAEDNAAGVAIVTGAARAILKYAKKPQRTIRVVLFADEEFGELGARAYAETHAGELGRHVLAMESDSGSDPVWRMGSKLPDSAEPFRVALLDALKPLAVSEGPRDEVGGSDIQPLARSGVPAISLLHDTTRYFDVHHSSADTIDHLNRQGLRQGTAAYATAAWLAANWPGPLGRLPILAQ